MYIRKAYLEVYEKKDDLEPTMVINGLRMTGEIKYAYDSADVVARIVVYNLSLDNRKALMIRDRSKREDADGVATASYYVKLYVGHQDEDFIGGEKPLILQGPAMNVFSFSRRPDVHTVLYIVPSGHAVSYNKITSFEATPNMTLEMALKEIGRRGGYEVVETFRLPYHIRTTSVRGQVFGLEKSIQKEMLKLGNTYHFMTRYSANKMSVKLKANLPLELAVQEEVSAETDSPPPLMISRGVPSLSTYKISIDRVQENPQVGAAALNVSIVLAPEMEHVEVIDLSEVKNQLIFDNIGDPLYRDDSVRQYLTSDLYRVSEIIHIFDTHGQAWTTHITAHLFIDGMSVVGG